MVETHPLTATSEETLITSVRAVSKEQDCGSQGPGNPSVRRERRKEAGCRDLCSGILGEKRM